MEAASADLKVLTVPVSAGAKLLTYSWAIRGIHAGVSQVKKFSERRLPSHKKTYGMPPTVALPITKSTRGNTKQHIYEAALYIM